MFFLINFSINVKFFDLRSSKKALNELTFNFTKLSNFFDKNKYSVEFEKNHKEIFEKFYLDLVLSKNSKDEIIRFVEIFTDIDKIFLVEGKNTHLLIKLFNSKEKFKLSFFMSRICPQSSTSKIPNFNTLMLIRKKEKIEDDRSDKTDSTTDECSSLEELDELDLDLDLKKHEQTNTTSNFNNKNSFRSISPLASLFSPSNNQKNFANTSTNASKNQIYNKENISNLVNTSQTPTSKKLYTIIYDKKYSGIKKRNTPDEERKKYVICVENIINDRDLRTTVMIKNIPNFVTQIDLLEKINKNFKSSYNFFYLPIDFNKKSNAGYAFINFKTAKEIVKFYLELEGKTWDFANTKNKLCYLSYARIQGFRAISEHFEKSQIMKQIDDKLKPIIIK